MSVSASRFFRCSTCGSPWRWLKSWQVVTVEATRRMPLMWHWAISGSSAHWMSWALAQSWQRWWDWEGCLLGMAF